MTALEISGDSDGLRIRVRVKPRARRSQVLAARSGMLEVAVAAPPVDGEANEELVRLLSSVLGVGRRSIEIVSGTGGRTKLVQILGLTAVELASRLSGGDLKR